MANSFTANFSWTKPEVGADTNAWGGHLNADMDAIDNIVARFASTTTSKVLKFNSEAIGTTTARTITWQDQAGIPALISGTDTTRKFLFDASGISTTTTRIITLTDADITMVGAANTQTVSNKTLVSTTFDAPSTNAILPAGIVVPYAGAAAPTGWLFCDGSAVSRTTFSVLFAAVNTTYGAGNGSTTFNVPDLRGRVAAGKDDMGGSAANRITSTTVPNSPILGSTGGAQTETTTVSVTGSAVGDTGTPSSLGGVNTGGSDLGLNVHTHGVNIPVTASGNTAATTNVQPTIILNQIIKT